MPIEIRIYTVPENGNEREQIDVAMEALGFIRHETLLNALSSSVATMNTQGQWSVSAEPKAGPRAEPSPGFEVADIVAEQKADVEEAKAATQRQRGQPSPGKARRTKAEIAEDEAADAAVTAPKRMIAEYEYSISNGEERLNPDDEQDAADEAAEAAANKTSDAPTHEDLRKALADYSKKHGMKAAVAAVKPGGVIGCTVDQVPVERIADVISTLRDVRKAEVLTDDAPATAEEPAVPTYAPTKDGLMKAMLDYALKYDGTNDIAKASMEGMPATMTDCPAIFEMRFGAGIKSLSKVPADGYAQAIADVQEATVKNPFKRGEVQ